MAMSLRVRQAEPRRDGDVSLQDHHRPASSCSDSAQSRDRSENRLQRSQQDDRPRHADLRLYQIRREAKGDMQPKPYSCTNARERPVHRTLTVVLFRLLLAVAPSGLILLSSASAQIRTDGSVGPARSLLGPNFAIGADLGKQVGRNLFHSFSSFNVGQGQTATFSGPAPVNNIIGRVTGGQTSQVDGQVASTIPGANLFLLNPSGWVFGPHATLNVQGSVHVSSTDTLHFADGTRLPTGTPTGSSLTSAPPEAFGFLGGRSGAITVTGSRLTTPVGKDLSLVGGPVRIEGGQVLAPAGKLHIASAASAGTINLNGREAPAQTAPAYGPMTVSGNAVADVGDPSGRRGGGAVQVRGGAVLVDGSTVGATNSSNQPGGTVSVKADALTLRGGGTLTTSARAGGDAGAISVQTTGATTINGDGTSRLTGISSSTLTGSSGRAGSVAVASGGELRVTMGGTLGNQTNGTGRAEPVSVTAPKITVDATGSSAPSTIGSLVNRGSFGDAGPVSVTANAIDLRNRGVINSSTSGAGNAGQVQVTGIGTNSSLTIDGGGGPGVAGVVSNASERSSGAAGNVTVSMDNIHLLRGGQISSSTYSSGNAGPVTVHANILSADGAGRTDSPTGVFSSNANPGSSGKAGPITVTANTIDLRNRGVI